MSVLLAFQLASVVAQVLVVFSCAVAKVLLAFSFALLQRHSWWSPLQLWFVSNNFQGFGDGFLESPRRSISFLEVGERVVILSTDRRSLVNSIK